MHCFEKKKAFEKESELQVLEARGVVHRAHSLHNTSLSYAKRTAFVGLERQPTLTVSTVLSGTKGCFPGSSQPVIPGLGDQTPSSGLRKHTPHMHIHINQHTHTHARTQTCIHIN